jgi:hypothetical protein
MEFGSELWSLKFGEVKNTFASIEKEAQEISLLPGEPGVSPSFKNPPRVGDTGG